MVKLAEFTFKRAPLYLIVDVTVTDYRVDSIEKINFISIDQTSYITFGITAETKEQDAPPATFRLDHVIDTTLVISSVESNNYKYVVKSATSEILEDFGVKITLELDKQYTSYCENINPVDPFLMFYRKFLPYSRYAIYGSYKDEFYELGEIERITYDTNLDKYKLYSSKGIVIYYDTLPLVNPSKVDVAGTQYTNPPTLIWLIDTQDLDDLMFIDTIQPTSINIQDPRYDSFTDWAEDFSRGKFKVSKMSLEARSVNKRIIIDFSTYTTLDYTEFIRYISYDIVKVFKIPFKQVYFKMGEQFTLTRLILEYDGGDYQIQIDGNFNYITAKG